MRDALRINVYRYINDNQEPPRSAFYASQPPSLFNACMRDQIRQWEDANDTPNESSIGSWCTCNVNQVGRYLTEEDRKAFLENFSKYYDKIENERIYRLLTRLNACKRRGLTSKALSQARASARACSNARYTLVNAGGSFSIHSNVVSHSRMSACRHS